MFSYCLSNDVLSKYIKWAANHKAEDGQEYTYVFSNKESHVSSMWDRTDQVIERCLSLPKHIVSQLLYDFHTRNNYAKTDTTYAEYEQRCFDALQTQYSEHICHEN